MSLLSARPDAPEGAPLRLRRAMILAAGHGTRMRPLTDHLPKPLVPVLGRTLIDRVIDRLAEAGIEEIVVNVHYRADQLEAHLRQRKSPRIHISNERVRLLDTGGAVVKALDHFKGEVFLTYNADSIWREGVSSAIGRMLSKWDEMRMDALMLLAATVQSTGFDGLGDFNMDQDGRIMRRKEKHVAPFAWTGVQIVHPRLYAGAPAGPFSNNLVWDRAIESGRLFGMRLDGLWMHVGTPEGLKEAEAALIET